MGEVPISYITIIHLFIGYSDYGNICIESTESVINFKEQSG